MKDILSRESLPVLAQLAWSNVLLGFDYDGTLAPIVDDPDQARMRKSTSRLLRRIANAYPCIVISGRSQRDTRERLEDADVFEVLGNHGIEPWHLPERFARQVDAWVPALRRDLARVDGVVIEDKRLSIAVHYRRAASRERARATILDAVTRLHDARIVGGKCTVNVIPRGAPHKGTALLAAREFLRCDVALYVGDDDTDEDVFALDDPGRLMTIRVEPCRTSAAAFFVADQQAIDLLLTRLLELRADKHHRQ